MKFEEAYCEYEFEGKLYRYWFFDESLTIAKYIYLERFEEINIKSLESMEEVLDYLEETFPIEDYLKFEALIIDGSM